MSNKIAIIHPHVAIKGGAVKTLLYFANFLQEEGYEVEFFTLNLDRDNCFPELNKNIKIITPKTPVLNKFYGLINIAWKIRKFDIIIVGNSPMHFVAVLSKLFNTGVEKKIFWYIQNIPYYFNTGVVLKSFLEKLILPFIDKLIVNSLFIQDIVQKFYKRNAEIIYPSIDTDFFSKSGELKVEKLENQDLVTREQNEVIHKSSNRHSELVSESTIDTEINSAGRKTFSNEKSCDNEIKTKNQKPKTIFTYSRLVKGKNIELAIDAFFELKKEFPDLQLVIGGDGEEKSNLQSLSKNNKDIIFLGELTPDQVLYNLQKSDIFLFTSLIDAFGLTILEAMSVGIGVVSMNYGGTQEIITNGENGFLATDSQDFVQKIRTLLLDDNLSQKFINNGKVLVKNKFSLISMKTELLKILL